MAPHCLGMFATLLMIVPGTALAESPVEELPSPPAKRALAKEAPSASENDLRESTATTIGWGLYGPRGRFCCVGQLAIADYQREGRRNIVILAEEDRARLTKPDPNFLYYRESDAGHRWAISRQPRADGSYRIYFQLAGTPGSWRLFQRSWPAWEEESVLELSVPIIVVEPTCGH